ncbi:EEF1A lysine methyltransferase 3-like [Scyliorhinus canicula]|uniref:EEF1A lysine methyltransferase 3-like n=1 Tax=Scyliorhinus canicula TaxID=7830 RepID=UPI0018F59345|nr:EEF1A lysine methyltransferase 3-like [Scyliorhinus canicula]
MTTIRREEESTGDDQNEESPKPDAFILENAYEFCGYHLRIARFVNADLGYSSHIWDSAIFLCNYFEKENINFTGKKVIELGSGTGMVGILAALLGGDVTLTDKPKIRTQLENNVGINMPSVCNHRIRFRPLVWGEDLAKFSPIYDFVLGTDIVYSSAAYPALVKTLRYFGQLGTTIIMCSELRSVHGAFHDDVITQYFHSQIVARLENKDINVYKITKLESLGDTN